MLHSPPSMKRIAMSSTYSTLASNGDGAGNFRLAPTSKPRSVGMSAAVIENASTILHHSAKVLGRQRCHWVEKAAEWEQSRQG